MRISKRSNRFFRTGLCPGIPRRRDQRRMPGSRREWMTDYRAAFDRRAISPEHRAAMARMSAFASASSKPVMCRSSRTTLPSTSTVRTSCGLMPYTAAEYQSYTGCIVQDSASTICWKAVLPSTIASSTCQSVPTRAC